MLSDRIRANRKPEITQYGLRNERASMYPEKLRHATASAPGLGLLELRVPLDKFFRAAAWKTHRNAPVFIVAFDAHDRSHAEAGVPHLSPKHRICIAAAFNGGPAERTRCGTRARSGGRRFLCAPYTAEKLLR
jgi:hypothetical protein